MKEKLRICYIPYDGRELGNKAFDKKYDARWTNVLKRRLEKEGHSFATYDINTVEESDVILCFDNVYFQNNRHFMKCYDNKKLGDMIHIDYEPPSANCKIHDNKGLKKLSNLFRTLITYNDDVVNNDTIVKGCIGDYLEKEMPYKNDFSKRKFLCVVANYRIGLMLFGQHKHELYSKRKEAVDYFQKKCPEKFDLYGSYWPEESSRCLIGPLERSVKQETLSQYKFIISYDSIKNQRGYISEKIFDCFKAKIVPIYWGADNVTDYIPKECFIDRRDFKTYDDLYDFLKNMSEDEYNSKIKAQEDFLHSELFLKLFSSQASADIIYNQIMAPTRNVDYKKAKKILDSFEKKRLSNYKYNFNNFYHETSSLIFNNKIDTFTSELRNGEYYLKLSITMLKQYNPYFFLKLSDNKKADLVFEKEKSEVSNSYTYQIYLSFREIYFNKEMRFFIKEMKKNVVRPMYIDTIPEINKILYDAENELKATDNKLEIIKTRTYHYNRIKQKVMANRYGKPVRLIIRIVKLPYKFLKRFIECFN